MRDNYFALGADAPQIYGGFVGNEVNREDRNWTDPANETILSGNIGNAQIATDNSYHIISAKNATATAVLDGFTITDGYDDQSSIPGGGAAITTSYYAVDPTSELLVKNCIIKDNFSRSDGGAVFNYRTSMVFVNCEFSNNVSENNGGAIYTSGGDVTEGDVVNGDITLIDCLFADNIGKGFGGALRIHNCAPIITNCVFRGNTLSWDFGQNNPLVGGGAIYIRGFAQVGCDATTPTLTNCTIVGNECTTVDKMICGGVYVHLQYPPAVGEPTLTNCIIWGNTDEWGEQGHTVEKENIYWYADSEDVEPPNLTYSCLEGLVSSGDYDVTSNIASNPQFADQSNDDLHLSYKGTTVSPCINAGSDSAVPVDTYDADGDSNTTESTPDLDLYSRIAGVDVDMGAYEYRVVHVDHDVSTSGDGSSWANAYKELRDGLAFANQWPAEVWVAKFAGAGYKPTDGLDRTISFNLAEGVRVYGGFDGSETSFDERNVSSNQAVLSGDIDPSGTADSYHVVTALEANMIPITRATVLSGFKVRLGNANGSGDDGKGGGMLISGESEPTVADCLFQFNSATSGGGVAIVGTATSGPSLTDVAFSDNTATGNGGGLYNEASHVGLRRCGFKDNTATGDGGGAYHTNNASPWTSLCVFDSNTAANGGGIYYDSNTDVKYFWANAFYGNRATGHGAGLYNKANNIDMLSSLFSGNWATHGGGSYFDGGTTVNVINCTYAGNIANDGFGAAGHGGGIYVNSGSPDIDNGIFWSNSSAQGQDDEEQQIYGTTSWDYSCVEGWSSGGMSNIGSDPKFVDPNGVDNITGTPDDNLRLQTTSPASPCIDAGNNTPLPIGESGSRDFDGAVRVVDGNCDSTADVDMGSYEVGIVLCP